MHISNKSIINYLAVFTIFCDTLTFRPYVKVSYLLISFVLLLILRSFKDIYFNRTFFVLFNVIIVFSLYNVLIGKDTLILVLKQIIGIYSSALMFYLLFPLNNYDVKKLFRVYLNIAFCIAMIGLIQELSYFLGFQAGYDFSNILPGWPSVIVEKSSMGRFFRITSILMEPSHFCIVMMPAFFASVTSLTKANFRPMEKWKSLIVVFSLFFSFSSTGYLGVLFSLLLLLRKCRKLSYTIANTVIICAFVLFAYHNIGNFRTRVDDSFSFLAGAKEMHEVNQSTFALVSNAHVAYNSFKDSPFIGSGLGSHQVSYDNYIGEIVNVHNTTFVNKEDAGSLFLRLLSETGLFGLLITFIFLFRCHIQMEDRTNYLGIINNAVLSMLFLVLVRSGHYFVFGFFFFFWLYYFAYKVHSKSTTTTTTGPRAGSII